MKVNELQALRWGPLYEEDDGATIPATEAETPEAEVKTYTEDEVQQMIAEASSKAVEERLARERKKAAAEQAKAVEEAEKLAKMNASERMEHENAKLTEELEALRAEKARAEMTATAKQMLKADGIEVPDALVSVLISSDAEQTSEAVKAFSATYQVALQEGIKKTLAGSTPIKGNSSAITKEEILAMTNDKERLQAIKDNMELFK